MRISGAAFGPEVLSHPLVLKEAWMRVQDWYWYRSGNLAPAGNVKPGAVTVPVA